MRYLLFLLAAAMVSASSACTGQASTYNYISAALQADLSGADDALSASKNAPDIEQLQRFRARFIQHTEGLPLGEIDDVGVRRVAAAYQDYWRTSLLAPQRREAQEVVLISRLRNIIAENDSANEGAADDFLSEAELAGFTEHPTKFEDDRSAATVRLVSRIEQRGLQALTGRTPPLLDLMLWRRNRQVMERVELTDGVVSTPVTYLEGFIVSGWGHFATLGEAQAGGWANTDGLFVVGDAYKSLEDESFQISFLKHESRHFADATAYPNISSADLEYRAKLTELVFAQSSMDHILARFANHRAKVDVPHPLASWHVMKDLAQYLYGAEAPVGWWRETDHERIRAAALALLERNTDALDAAGAKTTEGLIRL